MIETNACFQVAIEKASHFNYSFCFHNLSLVEKIKITAVTKDIEQIKIEITSEIGLFSPYTFYIDRFLEGTPVTVENLAFDYNIPFIRNLVEKDLDTLTCTIYSKNEILYQQKFTVNVLPMDYFGGLSKYPELLASYVLPNHDIIYTIKAEAVKILEKNRLTPAFLGYQSDSKDRVLQEVMALYQAILNINITYSAMPASFETEGQRIRLVDQIWETKFGNCIDISLLFAACLEAIDLNPILIVTQGHAFIGVWLSDQRLEAVVNYDQAAISKRIAHGIDDIALIESTHLCRGNAYTMREAMNIAETQLLHANNFILSLDIKHARSHGILPLPFTGKDELNNAALKNTTGSTKKQAIDYFNIDDNKLDLVLSEVKDLTKQKIWERKLLDLSLRNNLLNLRFTKSMLQIVDLKTDLLEDHLSNGKSLTIHPNNSQEVLRRYNLYLEPLHSSEPLFKLADDEFRYNRLLTLYHQDDLDNILTHLYRNAKLAEEENGKSTLYLGVGLLKWFEPKTNQQPRLAPILLIPVELSRRSVNTKFTLRSREEEAMINITLLEYLKQEFKLNLNALEVLPMDESGVDVQKVFAILRKSILNLEGWDIQEQVVLGNFSFNKLILWQDLTKYAEEIKKSTIVKSLIDGRLSDLLDITGDSENLEQLPSSLLTLPIPTDNSQLEAVRHSNANKSFVLHGPPGTGKSQTITNIIANALANDKKVLFVAAKKAALDVVHRRLEKIGLGSFCLELHSNKSKKSDVLRQLEQSLETPKYQSHIDFQEEAQRIDQRKAALSQYVDSLHQPFAVGWSLYDSVSYLDSHHIEINTDWLLSLQLEHIDKKTWNNWQDWAIPFGELTHKLPAIDKHPLHLIHLKDQNFAHKNNIEKSIEDYIQADAEATKALSDLQLNLTKNWIENKTSLYSLLEKITHFSAHQTIVNVYFDVRQKNLLDHWVELQSQKQTLENALVTDFGNRIFTTDWNLIESTWNQSKHSWFLPKWLKQRKVKKFLNGFATNKITSEQQVDQFFYQKNSFDLVSKNLAEPQFYPINEATSYYLIGNTYNLATLQQHQQELRAFNELAQQLKFENFQSWLNYILAHIDLKLRMPILILTLQHYADKHQAISAFLVHIPEVEVLNQIKQNLDQLEDWIRYNYYKDQGIKLGLSWLIDLLESNKINKDALSMDMESVLHLNYFVNSLDQSSILNGFDAAVYEAQILQYKTLHQEFTRLVREQLVLELSNKIPNLSQEAVHSSEIGILQRAIRNRGRGVSIRRLFDQISTLLPRLKPCMLMSPISVAQYFDVNTDHFDLVIFDEASQLPTSEAISALARAKQAIIVGDPKQMPPTSFFASNKIDEDHLELEDLESILDDSLALSIPSKYLLRHYRSKHESLISFSNSNFYENKLLTFPSHDDQDKKVSFQFIDGHYDKGKTRTNLKEAEAVIQYIKQHLEHRPHRSLGVVTFSQTQQNLIEDLLQSLFSAHPDLEETALQGDEPIFIKNLENVQGDERDFILFSIGYGPDEDGKVSMNFGPLNRDGGWRRLNVAVTRARYEMRVFSSLKGDQIDLNRTSSAGVEGLKAFLNFAERGVLQTAEAVAHDQEKYTLIQSIAKYLDQQGIKVKTNIGTSGYRVDIGIVDPLHAHQYILGILVDGKNYFNTQTTNDRELLIPNVLQSLGWNIYRIWTLDWIKNRDKILNAIKAEIQRIVNDTTAKEPIIIDASQAQSKTTLSVLSDDAIVLSKMKPYVSAKVNPMTTASPELIYDVAYRTVLSDQILKIIRTESPISQNHLFRKVLRLWNTTRATSKLVQYLTELTRKLPGVKEELYHQIFYWDQEQSATALTYYRDNNLEKRAIEDIAPEEIEIALIEVMDNSLSLLREDLVRATARAFAFSKTGAQIDSIINTSIDKLLQQGYWKSINGRIVLI
ncbi:superfamily I DNA and/or RNA helicase [Sphingobacterium detergens]|uniref:Superfamily I DNA and/or RNA helicase n=1 Tax=Sphingobacterium detergens TaxID=1145106 RepID=A0A420BIP8_SPHD1|nr:superfamily I DNA and/or RNA helicase [Sphingobacterium detergens]